jgi:hypothetical protein
MTLNELWLILYRKHVASWGPTEAMKYANAQVAQRDPAQFEPEPEGKTYKWAEAIANHPK